MLIGYLPKIIQLLKDLDSLQLSQSPDVFEKASQLFMNKYASYEDFLSYFIYEWLEEFRNWYEGAAENAPATNNELETFNRYFKEERTLRERLPVAEFIDRLCQWIIGCVENYFVFYFENRGVGFVQNCPTNILSKTFF